MVGVVGEVLCERGMGEFALGGIAFLGWGARNVCMYIWREDREITYMLWTWDSSSRGKNISVRHVSRCALRWYDTIHTQDDDHASRKPRETHRTGPYRFPHIHPSTGSNEIFPVHTVL